MGSKRLIIGYDLGIDYAQISLYNEEKGEPESVKIGGDTLIPTVLCRPGDGGEWLAGRPAEAASDAGLGDMVRGFTSLLEEEPVIDVGGNTVTKEELIFRFTSAVFKELTGSLPEGEYAWPGFITVSMAHMGSAEVKILKNIMPKLGIGDSLTAFESHSMSYEYYALSQPRELWLQDVGLFEYDRRGLRYYNLSVSWKTHPPQVTVSDTDLGRNPDGSGPENMPAAERDRKFTEAVREVSEGRTISTFYLVGENFEDEDGGSGWMNASLRLLCSAHRHVFVGQNLYSKGACYHSRYMAGPSPEPLFVPVGPDILTKDIYINAVHANSVQKVMLAKAGTAWYSAGSEHFVILDGTGSIVVHIKGRTANSEKVRVLELDGLPEREPGTTRVRINTEFDSPEVCHISVRDMGFGDICPSTGREWEFFTDIDSEEESTPISGSGTVIETSPPQAVTPLEMKMSGIKIYSLEELCWYVYKHVYAVTSEMFDSEMFDWMGQIPGGHSLALALENYTEGGKPLKETVRLLLSSVDYLTRAEINEVMRKLSDMENQNPVEQGRMAADNYLRYGHYMAALNTYHHVIYIMEHEYSDVTTKQFMAQTWHNYGIAFLKLHHVERAVECMERALSLTGDRNYLQALVRLLVLTGRDDRIDELAGRDDVDGENVRYLAGRCAKIIETWDESEEGRNFEDSFEAAKEDTDEYEDFVKEYLKREEQKYQLM